VLADGTRVPDGVSGESGYAVDEPRDTWITAEALGPDAERAASFLVVGMFAALFLFLGSFTASALGLGVVAAMAVAGAALGAMLARKFSKVEKARVAGASGTAALYLRDTYGKREHAEEVVRAAMATAGITAAREEKYGAVLWTAGNGLKVILKGSYEGNPARLNVLSAGRATLADHVRFKGAVLDTLGVREPMPPSPPRPETVRRRRGRRRFHQAVGLAVGPFVLVLGVGGPRSLWPLGVLMTIAGALFIALSARDALALRREVAGR